MLSYIFAIVVLLAVLYWVIRAYGGTRRPSGRIRPAGEKPVEHQAPAASEPTPAASETSSNTRIENAQRRTPPA